MEMQGLGLGPDQMEEVATAEKSRSSISMLLILDLNFGILRLCFGILISGSYSNVFYLNFLDLTLVTPWQKFGFICCVRTGVEKTKTEKKRPCRY